MRIAILNWNRRQVGGAETYLNRLIPALINTGHEVAFWHEIDEPFGQQPILLPESMPVGCVADLGAKRALAMLQEWEPEVIYVHGLADPKLETAAMAIAPAILFAHNYYGTCISGAKTFKYPHMTPCPRRFGWACLMHYYPRRCGGLSPITMWREYRRQTERLDLLRQYPAVITFSKHMRTEYLKHGLNPQRVHCFPFLMNLGSDSAKAAEERSPGGALTPCASIAAARARTDNKTKHEWRLLFLGRMTELKGGLLFLEAAARIRLLTGRPLHVTFAGDGPARYAWEQQAKRLHANDQGLRIEFVGWVDRTQRNALLDGSDLLVVPSVWPEPFGLVGLEAAGRGVPSAAFAVGGIPEWLMDGINGYLAPGDPPTAAGLAEAIFRCLREPDTYARLRCGAVEVAERFGVENHLAALTQVNEQIAQRKQIRSSSSSPRVLRAETARIYDHAE